MEEIQVTQDYSLFKKLRGNRPLHRGHLKKLTRSLEKSNRLNLHPIVVNKNFEVIDGQHRLQCAEDLRLPIYYIKSEEVETTHLIDCNVNQRTFEVENYIDFFAVRDGKPEYIKLKGMLKRSKLRPKALITLLLGRVSHVLLDFLKTGKFKFPEGVDEDKILNFYMDFISYVEDKRITPPSMFTNHNFTKALRWVFHTRGFTEEIFFKKLDLRWYDLKPQRGAEEWYTVLLSIYNFKNHARLEEDFGR